MWNNFIETYSNASLESISESSRFAILSSDGFEMNRPQNFDPTNNSAISYLMDRLSEPDAPQASGELHMSSRDDELHMPLTDEEVDMSWREDDLYMPLRVEEFDLPLRDEERQRSPEFPRTHEEMLTFWNPSRYITPEELYRLTWPTIFQRNDVDEERYYREQVFQDDLALTAEDERRCQNIVEPSCIFKMHVPP